MIMQIKTKYIFTVKIFNQICISKNKIIIFIKLRKIFETFFNVVSMKMFNFCETYIKFIFKF